MIVDSKGRKIPQQIPRDVVDTMVAQKTEEIKILKEDVRNLYEMSQNLTITLAYMLQQLPEDHEFQNAGAMIMARMAVVFGGSPPQDLIDNSAKLIIEHCKGKH